MTLQIDKADLMGAAEVRELLGVSDKTLGRYRKKHWQKNIHYCKPVQRIFYIRPLIMDWILNHEKNPMAHQDAMEAWYAKTEEWRNSRRKSKQALDCRRKAS
jgi:hypothetical protein